MFGIKISITTKHDRALDLLRHTFRFFEADIQQAGIRHHAKAGGNEYDIAIRYAVSFCGLVPRGRADKEAWAAKCFDTAEKLVCRASGDHEKLHELIRSMRAMHMRQPTES